ncbi:serine/threonine-protein kinase [Streptomyces hiroshimensis]|uniref:non-specific serine/threonine protein kinase n=1 Tax=Streptomyces hiroshimensis TaxID=66424 RepID=A0ABQ2YKQ2_9ACTN|nr:serine/threonine-protein kinase [Streptomyces hiroshimensis]GGX85001.1 protein kinase [Streptomyces hiroshimensis]
MTNDGGRPTRPAGANEPTSYDLQPPSAPVAANGGAPAAPGSVHPPATGTVYTPGAPNPYAAPAAAAAAAAAVADGSDHGAGRRIGNRYRLISRLGHGGMGTVWKAHDEVVDREVAVKEPRVPDHLPASLRENVHHRMQREARAAARVAHPSVVAVHDVVVEDGRPWIVMELVRGSSLGDRLAEGTLDPREAARIGLAVLNALGAAHEAGVLHRDVKPDNVLLGRDERVVLTDFGIAQIEGEQGLTETGAFVGSPEYVAPERVLGQRPGPESDLWSLGVVLYRAVEGVSPFRRSNAQATMQAILSAEPQMPSRGAGVLGALVMGLLHKNPAARPGTAEIRRTLEALARPASSEEPAFGATRPPQATGSKWVPPVLHGNRKAQWGLGAGVVAVATAATLLIVNPFAVGPAIPLHWKVRDEPEIVRASMAVPEEYEKSINSDINWVYFQDPSDVFGISLDKDTAEQRSKSTGSDEPKDIGTPEEEAKRLIKRYTTDSGTKLTDAKATTVEASPHDGMKAAEVVTVFRRSGSNETDPKRRLRTEIIVNDAKTVSWTLEVRMPEKGEGRKAGDKLFEDVLKYLKIQDK